MHVYAIHMHGYSYVLTYLLNIEFTDCAVDAPFLTQHCLFLFLIINARIQMKMTNNPNSTPPTTEGTMIVNGVESVDELDALFIGIILVGGINVVFLVIILVGVVIIWILVVG